MKNIPYLTLLLDQWDYFINGTLYENNNHATAELNCAVLGSNQQYTKWGNRILQTNEAQLFMT